MRKTVLFIGMVVFLIGGSLAITHAVHKTIPAETVVGFPGPFAEAVYTYITLEDPYKKWDLWPGKGKKYKGAHPHGAYLTTYINDNAKYSIKAKAKMANGSIIVKENYTDAKKLDAVTIMYKLKDYNPSAGDWYWAKYDKNGKVLVEGKAKKCIGCHAQKKANDYVFTDEFIK